MKVSDLMTLYTQDKICVIESQRQYEFDVEDLQKEFNDVEITCIYGNSNGTITIGLDVIDCFVEATWFELYG